MKNSTNMFTVKILTAFLGLSVSPVMAEFGCPSGFKPDDKELFPDPEFNKGYSSFTTSIPFKAELGNYPTDANSSAFGETGIGIVTGNYHQPDLVVSQNSFPGDPNPPFSMAPAPPVDTWFAFNGNNSGSPDLMWSTDITGLTPNTNYAFTAYFSNSMAPGLQAQGFVAPLVSFRADNIQQGELIVVCDAEGGMDPIDKDCMIEATEDKWHRLGATINPGNKTTLKLSVHDGQETNSAGNDFAFTLISLQECVVIPPDGPDNDKDGVIDTIDIDDDNDGIPDITEGGDDLDTDGDGIVNRFDLDSDNDGIPDIIEALGEDDEARDGLVDNFIDNLPINPEDSLADGDGFHDPLESNPWEIPDTDSDTIPDFLDSDSDGDNGTDPTTSKVRTDAAEAGFIDTDEDGKMDNLQGLENDGWDDRAEAQIRENQGVLPNNDKSKTDPSDIEKNSIPDYRDPVDTAVDSVTKTRESVETQLEGGIGAFGLTFLPLLGLLGLARKKKAGTLIALLLPTLSIIGTPVNAAQGNYYVGAGIGFSTLEPRIVPANPPSSTPLLQTDDSDTGFKVFVGYDLRDWLSLEGWGNKLGYAKFNNGGTIKYTAFGLNLVGNFPSNHPGFSFLAKIGMADIQNSASSNIQYKDLEDPQITGALGAEYHFQNHFSLRGAYEYLDRDAQLISFSLLKRFGNNKQNYTPQPIPQPVKPPQTAYHFPNPTPAYPVPVTPPTLAPVYPAQYDNSTEVVTLTLNPVYFETDSHTLKPAGKSNLNDVTVLLTAYPQVYLNIVGHTDSRASDAYNVQLANKRVTSVKTYLTSGGIGENRLSTEVRGESAPVADNESDEGRALNRRVELYPTPDKIRTKP